jgi:hypothetical protein
VVLSLAAFLGVWVIVAGIAYAFGASGDRALFPIGSLAGLTAMNALSLWWRWSDRGRSRASNST